MAGMDLLRLVSQDPDSLQPPPSGAAAAMKGATGVWSAVRYLSKLGKDDTAVIQRHAGWVLQEDPEAALEVFVGAETRLSPSLVLPILEEHAPQYSAVYLEAMLENGDAPLEEFEGSLVDIYLREALMNESKLGPLHKIPGVLRLITYAFWKFTEVNENACMLQMSPFLCRGTQQGTQENCELHCAEISESYNKCPCIGSHRFQLLKSVLNGLWSTVQV